MKVFDQDLLPDHENSRGPYLKVIVGLILFIAMISHSRLDPSPLNLLRPAEGIGNWLGMPGALVAGCLTDLLGWCGFLLPLSLLVLNHNKILNRRQVVLLDTTVILMFTIGLGQLSLEGNTQMTTGLVGAVANMYLQEFPGKLITILIAAGFIVRYSKHYQLNLQFFNMIQQLGAISLVFIAYLDGFAQKRVSKLSRKLKHHVSPLSTASKRKLTAAKDKTASSWRVASRKLADWLLEHNPFYRIPIENAGPTGTGLLSEEATMELKKRKLLRHTIEELERRSAMEGT